MKTINPKHKLPLVEYAKSIGKNISKLTAKDITNYLTWLQRKKKKKNPSMFALAPTIAIGSAAGSVLSSVIKKKLKIKNPQVYLSYPYSIQLKYGQFYIYKDGIYTGKFAVTMHKAKQIIKKLLKSKDILKNPKDKKQYWYIGISKQKDKKAEVFSSPVVLTKSSLVKYKKKYKNVIGMFHTINDVYVYMYNHGLMKNINPKGKLYRFGEISDLTIFELENKMYGLHKGTGLLFKKEWNGWKEIVSEREFGKLMKKLFSKTVGTNPYTGNMVEIYDNITAIEATKGNKSLWAKEQFRHDFKNKSGKAKIFGLSDGSLLIKGKKKLWKKINYDRKEIG